MNHHFSQLSRHIQNVLVALSFGVIIGVPVGNAIAEARQASRPQEMQIESSTTAAAAVIALFVQYRKKRKPNDQAADNGKNQTTDKPKDRPKDNSKAQPTVQTEGNPSNPPSRSRGFGNK
jgi:predicted histidine transporter YuiF (NhaC family)